MTIDKHLDMCSHKRAHLRERLREMHSFLRDLLNNGKIDQPAFRKGCNILLAAHECVALYEDPNLPDEAEDIE